MILNFCAQTRRKLQMFIILYSNLKMRIGEEECIVLKISRLRLSREIFQPITVEITFFRTRIPCIILSVLDKTRNSKVSTDELYPDI